MLPFDLRKLFHQSLQLLVVRNGSAYALLPTLRYVNLPGLSVVALREIQSQVRFSSSTAASFLAASVFADRKRPPKETLVSRNLSDL
jgi:hypothetical protein